ncbi:hypothetical protein J2Y41_004700 [Arthrobacter sp. 1088]|nr:hypothetical protein [Arthrobacter sp. 1088]
MDQLAWVLAFVADRRCPGGPDERPGNGIAGSKGRQAASDKDPRDRSLGDPGGPAQPRRPTSEFRPGRDHSVLPLGTGLRRTPVRAAGSVEKAGLGLGPEPFYPAVGALPGNTQFLRHVGNRPLITDHPLNEKKSPVNGQTGISVGHEDLRGREDVRYLH